MKLLYTIANKHSHSSILRIKNQKLVLISARKLLILSDLSSRVHSYTTTYNIKITSFKRAGTILFATMKRQTRGPFILHTAQNHTPTKAIRPHKPHGV